MEPTLHMVCECMMWCSIHTTALWIIGNSHELKNAIKDVVRNARISLKRKHTY